MRLDELFRDSQSEAAALHFRARHAEVTVEDALVVARVDAASEVLHENIDLIVALRCPDDDPRPFGRVVDRVRQQVRDHPGDFFAVDEQLRDLFGVFDFDETAETFGQHSRRRHRVVDQFDRFGDLRHQLQLARLDLGQIQQLAGDAEQPVAVFADALREGFLLVVQRPEPAVFEQVQAHHDRRDRGFHLVRDGRDEIRFGGIDLLVFGDVVQDNHIADETFLLLADRRDVQRDVFHLEIALLVVGVDFQRLLIRVVRVEFADQPPQQVVVERHFRRVAADGLFGLQIQDRERFVVHEQDLFIRVETDDRFVQAVDDRFDSLFGHHQVVQRTALVFRQFFGHVVERFGYGAELLVAAEVETFVVVEIRDFHNPFFEFADRPDDGLREADQQHEGDQRAQDRADGDPQHSVFGGRPGQAALFADGRHVQIHDLVQVAADLQDLVQRDRIRQFVDLRAQVVRHAEFVRFGDIPALQREVIQQFGHRRRVEGQAVERRHHAAGVVQRVVIVGQDVPGGPRQVENIAYGLDAQQQDHGEQRADAQRQSSLNQHIRIILRGRYSVGTVC